MSQEPPHPPEAQLDEDPVDAYFAFAPYGSEGRHPPGTTVMLCSRKDSTWRLRTVVWADAEPGPDGCYAHWLWMRGESPPLDELARRLAVGIFIEAITVHRLAESRKRRDAEDAQNG